MGPGFQSTNNYHTSDFLRQWGATRQLYVVSTARRLQVPTSVRIALTLRPYIVYKMRTTQSSGELGYKDPGIDPFGYLSYVLTRARNANNA